LVTILAVCYDIPESVIVALISGVLLSTLGLVTIMVRFLFNDEAETEVIKAIQNVAGSYKKTGQNDEPDRIMLNK
jgi:flagellar basal body-associated protein FliL